MLDAYAWQGLVGRYVVIERINDDGKPEGIAGIVSQVYEGYVCEPETRELAPSGTHYHSEECPKGMWVDMDWGMGASVDERSRIEVIPVDDDPDKEPRIVPPFAPSEPGAEALTPVRDDMAGASA